MITKGSKPRRPKLYWCTTADHDEDWFVLARSAAEACRFHEGAEGYDPGDAEAECIRILPPSVSRTKSGWPSDEVLRACGVEVTTDKYGMRTARYRERGFAEGDVAMNIAARARAITRH
jgi:hypothetical protein